MPIGEVLFMRGHKGDNDDLEDADVWDDSDLVNAYDRAVKDAKAEVAQRLGLVAKDAPSASESCSSQKENNAHKSKSRKKKKKQRREWAVGDYCRARYSADGLYYEGTITNIHRAKGTCVIQFTGYGNEQEESVSLLLPSLGSAERREQEIQASEKVCLDMETSEGEAGENHSNCSSRPHQSKFEGQGHSRSYIPPSPQAGLFHDMVPPPPPLHITDSLPRGESEALSAMLMSWYMSGFHTGYFQGLKRAQRKSS